MDHERIDRLVAEVIDDLEKKTELISQAADTPDIANRVRLQGIKDEAVHTLNRAAAAIGNACSEQPYDPKQIVEGLMVAVERSQILYEKTMEQIRDIKGFDPEESKEADLCFPEPETEEIPQAEEPACEEDTMEETVAEETEEGTDEVTLRAHEVLESWIAPEGENK